MTILSNSEKKKKLRWVTQFCKSYLQAIAKVWEAVGKWNENVHGLENEVHTKAQMKTPGKQSKK